MPDTEFKILKKNPQYTIDCFVKFVDYDDIFRKMSLSTNNKSH